MVTKCKKQQGDVQDYGVKSYEKDIFPINVFFAKQKIEYYKDGYGR